VPITNTPVNQTGDVVCIKPALTRLSFYATLAPAAFTGSFAFIVGQLQLDRAQYDSAMTLPTNPYGATTFTRSVLANLYDMWIVSDVAGPNMHIDVCLPTPAGAPFANSWCKDRSDIPAATGSPPTIPSVRRNSIVSFAIMFTIENTAAGPANVRSEVYLRSN
jgi:hypothetical protein